MARYLVTGGGGFIGSHLVQALLSRGDEVRVLDNFSTSQRTNLKDIEKHIDLRIGSITDSDSVASVMHHVDYVLHHAALASVQYSIENPRQCHDVNATGTLNVLQAALRANVQKVVFAASSSAYGNVADTPTHEQLAPEPISPYASSKLAGEYYCRTFTQVYQLPTVILRYFNVFGPNQNADSIYSAVIPIFIRLMRQGESPVIYGDGLQSRDFTYIENIVHANLCACFADTTSHGQVINIASGTSYSLLDLVKEINALLGTAIEPVHHPERPGDVRYSVACITKAQELIGYQPKISFAQGLGLTLDTIAKSHADASHQ
jgi:UDP-glucose 4-epimerase